MKAKVVNPKYVKILIGVNYSLLFVSFCMLGFSYFKYTKVSKRYWTSEHWWLLILGMALIIYNNPLFFIVVEFTNFFWLVVSALSSAIFESLLCQFLLVVVKRTHQPEISLRVQFSTSSQIFFCIVYFVANSFFKIYGAWLGRNDFHFNIDYSNSFVYNFIASILAILFILFLVYFCINLKIIFKKWN